MAASKKSKKATKSKLKVDKLKHVKSSAVKSVKSSIKSIPVVKKLPPLEKIDHAFNKSQLLSTLAERTNITKKQASLVMDEFCRIIGLHVKKGGPEKFVLPGAFKVVVRKIPAKKARNGVNPFTGEATVFKAKPASRKVKIIALKSLKDMAI
jgi:nucleoid DNA-binding protein